MTTGEEQYKCKGLKQRGCFQLLSGFITNLAQFLNFYHHIMLLLVMCRSALLHMQDFPRAQTCMVLHTHKISDTKNLQFMKVVLIFSRVSRYCTWFFYFKDYNTNLKNKGSLSIVFGGQHHKKLKMAFFWKIDQNIASFTYIR